MIVIASIVILNFLTCFVARLCQGGKFVVKSSYGSKVVTGRNVMIAGFMIQPEEIYRHFKATSLDYLYLRYSPFGYNPINAGRQLNRLLRKEDIVYSASVGCKAAIFAKRNEVQNVLFNPIVQITASNPEQISIQMYGATILKIISYLMGWLAILPAVKMKAGQKGSFALFSDQKYWSYYGNPGYDDIGDAHKVGIIVNQEEIVLGSYVALLINRGAYLKSVEANRLSSMNPMDSVIYEKAAAETLANL